MNIIDKFRFIIKKLLNVPDLIIYKSDFPNGRLMGKPAQIGAFSIIDYGGNVEIGKNVKIGYGVTILSVSTVAGSSKEKIIRKPVIIEDDVEIGSGAVILPGVRIGKNSTIGAGAVVINDIPSNVVAVGVPAHPCKQKFL